MKKSLILGTVQFGLDYGVTNRDGQPSQDHIFEILDQAWHSGVRFLDTADSYGSAIDIIASYHCLSPHRFQVITKTLRNPAHAPADISLAVDQLKRQRDQLDIEIFDTVMFHYAPSINNHVPDDFFNQIKNAGITRCGGLSVDLAPDYDALKDRFSFDVVQIPFNVLNGSQFPALFRDSLSQLGVEIHVRSAFLQGILVASVDKVPAYLSGLVPFISRFHEACQQVNISALEGALLFLAQSPFPDHVVVGAQNLRQWQDIETAWKRVHELKERIQIDWTAFLCDNPDLVSPSKWATLKQLSGNL